MGKKLWLLALCVLVGACDQYSEAKEAVAYGLIDPTSPLFREVKKCYFNPDVIEGEVNAKNRMGAYVGFEPFLYYEGRVAIGYEDPNWRYLFELCTKNMPENSEIDATT